jgi:L-rhamnose isomerase
VADAAQVHALTGLAPSVALHIPWDEVDDYAKLREHAESLGIALGTINSNRFQADIYKLGSLAHTDAADRSKSVPAVATLCGPLLSSMLSVEFTMGSLRVASRSWTIRERIVLYRTIDG